MKLSDIALLALFFFVLAGLVILAPLGDYQFTSTWGSKGTGDGYFDMPMGIAVGHDGSVYVADSSNHRIQVFTAEGNFITKWGSQGSGNSQFDMPMGVAVDSAGNVYVADTYNHRIQIFTPDGNFITKWGSQGQGDGQFIVLQDVAVDSTGNIYAADTTNHRIQKFTPDGKFIMKWGSKGLGDGEFNAPQAVTVDIAGNVYVADRYNHRIQKFTSEGNFIMKWGSQGSGDGEFNGPQGIAADSNGNIFVADTRNGRVQVFTNSGKFMREWKTGGLPNEITVATDGTAYVADQSYHRIQTFKLPIPYSLYGLINLFGFILAACLLLTFIRSTYIQNKQNMEIKAEIERQKKKEEEERRKEKEERDKRNLALKAEFEMKKDWLRRDRALREEQEKRQRSHRDAESLIQKAEELVLRGQYIQAIHKVDEALRILPNTTEYRQLREELVKNDPKPEISISLHSDSLKGGIWQNLATNLTNSGNGDALTIGIALSGEVDTKRIDTQTVKAGEMETIEIPIRPRFYGMIPLEITLSYKDSQGRSYEAGAEFELSVEDQAASPVAAFTPQPQTPTTFPPELANKYTDVTLIGKGGFGRVFRANRIDGTEVAVKIPVSIDAATGKSFIAELQSWTRLSHPNIVRLYDYNIMPIPYFEMEYCGEGSLSEMEKPLGPREAAWLIFSICEGLKVAHKQQIIHRDLKPHNILMKSGVPKVTDWGLAKVMSEATTTTTTSFTTYYAAPEQFASSRKDERTDIWQIGIIFYELVTGLLPFKGGSMVEIMASIATKHPTPPGEIVADAAPVQDIILKCLEKEPKNRYQSVLELQRELAQYLEMNYTEELKKSVTAGNTRQATYYCGELVLTALHTGDPKSGYKYLLDLQVYAKGDVKDDIKALSDTLQFMVENQMEVSEDILMKADLLVHRMRVG